MELVKKFLSFSFGTWIGLIITVISTPIITRLIAPTEFAKASLFEMAINIIMLISIVGADQSFIRFFNEVEIGLRSNLLRNSVLVSSITFLMAATLILFFRVKISIFLFEYYDFKLVILLILCVLIMIYNRFSLLVIRMEQNGNSFSILQIILRLFEFIFIVSLLKAFSNFKGIILGRFIAILLVTCIAIFLKRKFWKFDLKLGKVRDCKEIINYGIPLSITALISWVFKSADKIAIREYSTLYDLGIYAGAFKIVGILTIIQTTFSTFWVPLAYDKYKKNPTNKIFFKEMFLRLTVILLIGVSLIIMFRNLIIMLLGKNYREAVVIMPMLLFIPLMRTLSEITVVGINFSKKVKWHIVLTIIPSIINVLGNYLLVPHFGSRGAAFSSAVSYILFFSLRTYFSNKFFHVSYGLKKFYLQVLAVFIYSFISTINNDIKVNCFLGILVILMVLSLNFKFIKKELKQIRSEVV